MAAVSGASTAPCFHRTSSFKLNVHKTHSPAAKAAAVADSSAVFKEEDSIPTARGCLCVALRFVLQYGCPASNPPKT